MAAAVPTGRLDDATDEFSLGLAFECAQGKVASLYSSGDNVLAYAFPLGETADCSSGHSEYWSGDAVQAEVRSVLDLGVTADRKMPDRTIPAASQIEERVLDSRDTVSRTIG